MGKTKKTLAMLLAICMVITMMPVMAFATGDGTDIPVIDMDGMDENVKVDGSDETEGGQADEPGDTPGEEPGDDDGDDEENDDEGEDEPLALTVGSAEDADAVSLSGAVALVEAGAAAIITIEDEYALPDNSLVRIPAGSNITIEGNDEAHSVRFVIGVNSSASDDNETYLTVNGLNMDGTSFANGMAFHSDASKVKNHKLYLSINDCVVENFAGKGIYASNVQELTVTGTGFKNNATYDGNGYSQSGDYTIDVNLLDITDAEITITDCTFTGKSGAKAPVKVTQRGGANDMAADILVDGEARAMSTIKLLTVKNNDFSAAVSSVENEGEAETLWADIILGDSPAEDGPAKKELYDFPVAITAGEKGVKVAVRGSFDEEADLVAYFAENSLELGKGEELTGSPVQAWARTYAKSKTVEKAVLTINGEDHIIYVDDIIYLGNVVGSSTYLPWDEIADALTKEDEEEDNGGEDEDGNESPEADAVPGTTDEDEEEEDDEEEAPAVTLAFTIDGLSNTVDFYEVDEAGKITMKDTVEFSAEDEKTEKTVARTFELHPATAYVVKISGTGTVTITDGVTPDTLTASAWVVRNMNKADTLAAKAGSNYIVESITVDGKPHKDGDPLNFEDTRIHTVNVSFKYTGGGSGGRGGSGKPAVEDPKTEKPEGDKDAAPKSFTDVAAGAWYAQAVNFVVEEGLFAGMSDTEFGPDVQMTRAMFVTVLGRLAENLGFSTTGSANTFADVPAGQWYTNYVAWGSANGIIAGYDASTFGVNDNVTREQMAVLFVKFAEYANIPLNTASPKSFTDAASVNAWAVASVDAAAAAGLINGYDDGSFRPQGTATRAEVATVFMNFTKAYGDAANTAGSNTANDEAADDTTADADAADDTAK